MPRGAARSSSPAIVTGRPGAESSNSRRLLVWKIHLLPACTLAACLTGLRTAALILVPTRELALQTAQVCKDLGKYLRLQIMTSTGGTNLRDDIMRLHQPVHIVVATPGRILDLARQGVAKLGNCGILVLDEVSSSPISLRVTRAPLCCAGHECSPLLPSNACEQLGYML